MSDHIALVGCGAIARSFYLPALAKHRAEFDHLWLVNPTDHALAIAASVLPGRQAHRLSDVDDEIRWVIVAAPNHLHFPLSLEALSRGADVLIEKPFAIWPEEGRRLAEAATTNDRIIAINQTRRFFPLADLLRRQIRDGVFGSLRSIVHREGNKLIWPFESGAGFAPGAQRTGVIMDFGVHVIDFYHYLLQPEWRFISAVHDGFCGPEGLAEIELQADDASVSIRLSRYNAQENVARLIFEHAQVSFKTICPPTYCVQTKTGKTTHVSIPGGSAPFASHAEPLLLNFLAASRRSGSAVCDANSSMPVIEILNEVYCRAERYSMNIGAV